MLYLLGNGIIKKADAIFQCSVALAMEPHWSQCNRIYDYFDGCTSLRKKMEKWGTVFKRGDQIRGLYLKE